MCILARHNKAHEEYIRGWNKYLSVKPSQQKEPLVPHPISHGPWEKVKIDIFQYGSCDYLLMADYFSNFLLIRALNNQTAAHVINILKTISSEHGILACVFTEQGRHFTSAEFWEFAKCYRFKVFYSTSR